MGVVAMRQYYKAAEYSITATLGKAKEAQI